MQERGHHIDNQEEEKEKRKQTESKSCKRKHFLVSEKGRTWILISQGKATHAYIYIYDRRRKTTETRKSTTNQ